MLDSCIEALENRQLQENIFKAFDDFLAEYVCGNYPDDEDQDYCRDKPHSRRIITQQIEIKGLKQTVDEREELADDQNRDNSRDRDKKSCDKFSLEGGAE